MRKIHPEQRLGEVFLTNTSDVVMPVLTLLIDGHHNLLSDVRSGWESIGWETKRRGKIAYDIYNIPIAGMFPVFVQRRELIAHSINPDRLFQSKQKI
jgi:hypothetical protein